jgi:UPF0271 protein
MATKGSMDLNCDLGEGYPHDRAIFPLISSANIACGGHAGDRRSVQEALERCIAHRVAAGAHPAYPDRGNFGRVTMPIFRDALRDALQRQLDLFLDTAAALRVPVHHVKLHGALYHDVSADEELADLVLKLLIDNGFGMVYGASGSRFNALAREHGFRVMDEVFADRAYTPEGGLLPRQLPGAVLQNMTAVCQQLSDILTRGMVMTSEGTPISLHADTICLHGDSPGTEAFIHGIRELLDELQLSIAAP